MAPLGSRFAHAWLPRGSRFAPASLPLREKAAALVVSRFGALGAAGVSSSASFCSPPFRSAVPAAAVLLRLAAPAGHSYSLRFAAGAGLLARAVPGARTVPAAGRRAAPWAGRGDCFQSLAAGWAAARGRSVPGAISALACAFSGARPLLAARFTERAALGRGSAGFRTGFFAAAALARGSSSLSAPCP